MTCRLSKILWVCFFSLSSLTLYAENYPVLSQGELDAYYSEVYIAIGKAEMNVQELQNLIGSGQEVPLWTRKLELQNAIVQLEVKKTLFANFRNSEALRSPVVRHALLQVLNTLLLPVLKLEAHLIYSPIIQITWQAPVLQEDILPQEQPSSQDSQQSLITPYLTMVHMYVTPWFQMVCI